jgi:muramoyltetrapeptide carboxypeptidase
MSGLQPGDEIRVVAPSQSWHKRSEHRYLRAAQQLEKRGFKVSFSKNIAKQTLIGAASAKERAADLSAAYGDKKVKAILALRGGWLTNDVLPFIDWDLVRANPKPLIGFSDITILLSAIIAQTGQVAFLGPTLSPLADRLFGRLMLEEMLAVLSQAPTKLQHSTKWILPGERKPRRAQPWKVLNAGQASGKLLGGNLGTLFLAQGTPYQPAFDSPYILVVEDDDEAGKYTLREFSRRLEAILQQPGARQNLRGLLVGRFLPGSKVKPSELELVIKSKQLGDIPMLAQLDFGHSLPLWTLPLGGQATIKATGRRPEITVQAIPAA